MSASSAGTARVGSEKTIAPRAHGSSPQLMGLAGGDQERLALGVVWAGGLATTLLVGPGALTLLLALAVLGASRQVVMSWRRSRGALIGPIVSYGPALIVISSLGGTTGIFVATVVALTWLFAVQLHEHRSIGQALHTGVVLVSLGVCVAATTTVWQGRYGRTDLLMLLALVAAYDLADCIVGTEAHASWEGPVAGAATIAAVSLAFGAILDPTVYGPLPWIIGAGCAVLAPAGQSLCTALLGDASKPAPLVRRLDALVLCAPFVALVVPLAGYR